MTAAPRLVAMRLQRSVRINGRHLQPGEAVAMPLELARHLYHQRRARPIDLADLALLLAELTTTAR